MNAVESKLSFLIRLKGSTLEVYSSLKKTMGSIEELLTKVENINYQDGDDDTLLHAAIKSGLEDIIGLLLKKQGIDINIINNEGKTPLDVARSLKKQNIVQMLELYIQQISTGEQLVNQQQPMQEKKVGFGGSTHEKLATSSSDQASDVDKLSTNFEYSNTEQIQGNYGFPF